MMKASITILVFATFIMSTAFAGQADQFSFTFDGSRNTPANIDLQSVQTHTEYRTETRQATCYRQVFVGYQPVCYWRQVPRCFYNRFGQYICQQQNVRHCENRPRYRTEPYSCTQQVQVPYEVEDFKVEGAFKFKFSRAPMGSTPHELFTVKLNGAKDSLNVVTSKNLIIYGKKESELIGDGELRKLNVSWEISFENLLRKYLPVLKGISEVEMDERELSFITGKIEKGDPVDVSLYLEQKKWGRNPVLINRVLNAAEYELSQIDEERSRVSIDLKALAPEMKANKKHKVKIGLTLLFDRTNVLNVEDLPDNAVTKEFIYKPVKD